MLPYQCQETNNHQNCSPLIMPLLLLDATADDLQALIELEFEVFSQTDPIRRAAFPNGLTPTLLTTRIAKQTASFDDPHQKHMKVVDSETVVPNVGEDCRLTSYQAQTTFHG